MTTEELKQLIGDVVETKIKEFTKEHSVKVEVNVFGVWFMVSVILVIGAVEDLIEKHPHLIN